MEPVAIADAEPFLSASEAIVDDQDRAFDLWLSAEATIRNRLRLAVDADPEAFTPEMFDEIIRPLERHLRRQTRITARLERQPSQRMSLRLRDLRMRVLARQRRQYAAAEALLRFLREIRAEVVARGQGEAPSPDWTPGATTVAALVEAQAGGLRRFPTVADLMADLHADD